MANEEPTHPSDAAGKSGMLGESFRKALVTGLSAVFSTEEGIRNALADLRLPKEAIAYVVQQTQASRREVVRIVSEEVKSFLKSTDVASVLRKALTGMKLDVHAQVRVLEDGISVDHIAEQPHEHGEAEKSTSRSPRGRR